jgi:hypothetical protein
LDRRWRLWSGFDPLGLSMLLRSYLLPSIDSVSLSTIWICVGGVFVALGTKASAWGSQNECEAMYCSVFTLPNRLGDAVD